MSSARCTTHESRPVSTTPACITDDADGTEDAVMTRAQVVALADGSRAIYMCAQIARARNERRGRAAPAFTSALIHQRRRQQTSAHRVTAAWQGSGVSRIDENAPRALGLSTTRCGIQICDRSAAYDYATGCDGT